MLHCSLVFQFRRSLWVSSIPLPVCHCLLVRCSRALEMHVTCQLPDHAATFHPAPCIPHFMPGQAYVSSANYAAKRSTCILFVNDRCVESGALRRALEATYAAVLPKVMCTACAAALIKHTYRECAASSCVLCSACTAPYTTPCCCEISEQPQLMCHAWAALFHPSNLLLCTAQSALLR